MTDNLLEKINLDDVLAQFSVWGRYHVVSMLWLTVLILCETMCYSNFVFVAEEVRYSCSDTANTSTNNINNVSVVTFNLSNIKIATSEWWCEASVPCTQWIYEEPDSFVAEFQLACQEWKRTLVGTAHSAGYMVGIFIVGSLSDRYGRRYIVVVTGLIGALCGLVKSFVSIYWIYIAIEFFEAAIGDPYSPLYMLILEMVATGSRSNYTSVSNLGIAIGGIMLAVIKWLIPYWRTYTRVIYAPMLLNIFLIYWIDESPRWLLTKGNINIVVKNIEKAAKLNKIEIKENLSTIYYEKDASSNYSTVIAKTLKSKTLLKRFFICVIWWNTCAFVDHGLSLNSVSLEGNRYVNYGLVCCMRLPVVLLAAYVLNKYGRKRPQMMSFVACTVLCALQPFIPKNQLWLGITIYMASKITSGMFFNFTYIFTSELFPTYTRNSIHALCSCLGRIGNIAATQMPLLMTYWSGLPLITYGATSLVAALVTLFVPDTAKAPLPDTVHQAEALDALETMTIPKENHRMGNVASFE